MWTVNKGVDDYRKRLNEFQSKSFLVSVKLLNCVGKTSFSKSFITQES